MCWTKQVLEAAQRGLMRKRDLVSYKTPEQSISIKKGNKHFMQKPTCARLQALNILIQFNLNVLRNVFQAVSS